MVKLLIVIPVYNEAKLVESSLRKLGSYLKPALTDYNYKIVVADNNSSDATGQIIKNLLGQINNLEYLFFGQKGKGLAVLGAWQKYQDDYDYFVFMDADLATDLAAFLPLISALDQGFDLAVGSRYLKESKIKRSIIRKIFSFFYSNLARLILGLKIKDLPCGFKAVKKEVVKQIVPQIKNKSFFFDSELLYLAAKKGFKIKEIPVIWTEQREKESKVGLFKVSFMYFKELIKLRFIKN